MLPDKAIFRAYDIRGIVATVLTPTVVKQIGQAFGSAARARQQSQVVIGYDGRLSSPVLAEALANGILTTGCDVINIGLVPTPVLYFATHYFATGTGIMITGSHNPPEYNGLKMMLQGETLHSEAIQALYTRIAQNQLSTDKAGDYREESVIDAYIERITSDISIRRPLKFAIDCGNGAAGEVAVKLFKALGLKPIELFCEIDGTFPNHHPDPSKPENLQDLQRLIAAEKLDLGLAFDGDGDRLGVVDAAGHIIWPDRQMMLYADDILARNPGGTVIFDVKSSMHLKQRIEDAGGQAVMSRTGHSFIKTKMVETHALLAGEMSGHIFFKERWYGFDDGLYTAARLLEILAKQSQSPQACFATLPDSINTPELTISFAEGKHYKFIDQFVQHADFPNAKVITIDGLRVEFPDGWGLVRASNTTPSLVLRFEADTTEALTRIQEQFRTRLLQQDATLKLPF